LAATAALAQAAATALRVDRPGADVRREPRRQQRGDRREQGVRQAQPLRQPAERRARAQRLGDRHGGAGRRRQEVLAHYRKV
jgi:hypothetical protein